MEWEVSAVAFWLPDVSRAAQKYTATGGVLPIADCRLPIADCRLPIADCRLPIADAIADSTATAFAVKLFWLVCAMFFSPLCDAQ